MLQLEANLLQANNSPLTAQTQQERMVLPEQLEQAQVKYEQAMQQVTQTLGGGGDEAKSYLGVSGKQMLELVPLVRRKNGKEMAAGRKWTYVRSDKVRSHVRSYKLNKADTASKSFIQQGKVDVQVLKQQLRQVSTSLAMKSDWHPQTSGFVFEGLQQWAEQLNVKADPSKAVQFSSDVQVFRYFAGCGAGMDWDPLSGKLSANVQGQAEFNLASGEAKLSLQYPPGTEGWVWKYTNDKNQDYLIGAFRLKADLEISGSAGASAMGQLGLEVDYSNSGKLQVRGANRPRGKTLQSNAVDLGKVNAEVGLDADAFVGVKAGGSLKGALDYKPPVDGEKFAAIFNIGPKVDVLFGGGVAAAFVATYDKGKFRAKARAGLCFGPGAKGEIGFEVDVKQLGQFFYWVQHALISANFEKLEFIQTEAFKWLSLIQVGMLNLAENIEEVYDKLETKWRDISNTLSADSYRAELMQRILNMPANELLHRTPEAHGIMLYLLTRPHQSPLLSNMGKTAVMRICRCAQSRSHLGNIIQHMTHEGAKGNLETNLQVLREFLDQGMPLRGAELDEMWNKLPNKAPVGFRLAMNDEPAFAQHVAASSSVVYQDWLLA